MHWLTRLIVSLVIVTAAASLGFSAWQAGQEKSRLYAEIDRRADVLTETFKDWLDVPLGSNDPAVLERACNVFSKRGLLFGVSVHNTLGQLVASSSGLQENLSGDAQTLSANIQEVEREARPYSRLLNISGRHIHARSVPVEEEGKTAYVLTIFQDADYLRERVWRIWLNSLSRVAIQIFFICLTTLIVFYLSVLRPMRKVTEWIRELRQGGSSDLDPKHRRLLGALGKEISKMAKNLEMARISAEEEARLRLSSDTIWTAERLKEFVRGKLQGRALFAVSNREPYMHLKKGNQVEWIVPASGLVTAIEPVLKACGGMWIAQGAGDADRMTVDKRDCLRVPPDDPQYTLRRVWVDPKKEKGFYNGFSNEGLWPLCHIAHTRPVFRAEDWEHYQAVNAQFAQAVLEEIESVADPCILIQDYHFALLPRLIKKKRPDARVAIFWHIPWPNPESFGICPWQKELLEGMLGADVVGFHTQFHCNNFIETVDRFLESRIDYEHFTVHREGQSTWIKSFAISIDAHIPETAIPSPRSERENEKKSFLKKNGIDAEFLGVGVDRLDYTKGILERFRSVERFLELHPRYVGRFVFVELAAPSRTAVPKYAEFMVEVEREVERINARFKRGAWKAILFFKKHHTHAEIRPYYKFADVCMVTSLHDGMNLVAKEFIAARDDERGVLVLSQFTGAARELEDALIVNPYDIESSAEAVRRALEMPVDEETDRMRNLRRIVRERNIYRWAADLVGELANVRIGGTREAPALKLENT